MSGLQIFLYIFIGYNLGWVACQWCLTQENKKRKERIKKWNKEVHEEFKRMIETLGFEPVSMKESLENENQKKNGMPKA